jgi:O-antigen/teichoic acid export membrane protein
MSCAIKVGTAGQSAGINIGFGHSTRASALPLPVGGSLSSNVSWTLTGNIVYAGCQWALLVALAKLGSPAQVGELALGLAVTGPLFVASQLHLRGVQATDARCEFAFGDYLGLRWISTAIALLLTVALACSLHYRAEVAGIIIILGLARAFDNLSDIYYGALLQHERMARIGKSMMLRGLVTLAGLITAVLLTGSVLGAAAAIAAVSALVFTFYDRRSVAFDREHPRAVSVDAPYRNPSGYLALFRLSLPLAVVMMFVSLNLNLPRYFIESIRGEADLGVFAALSYLIVAGNTVVNACGQATAPRLAKLYAYGPFAGFWRLLLYLIAVACVCGVVGVLVMEAAGEQILTALYNRTYSRYASLMPGLMGAAAILYVSQFLGYAMTAARIFRAQVPLFAAVAATTASACWLLVPTHGLRGAVAAIALGFAAQLVGSAAILFHCWLVRKHMSRDPHVCRHS